jgi:hypothetical protein
MIYVFSNLCFFILKNFQHHILNIFFKPFASQFSSIQLNCNRIVEFNVEIELNSTKYEFNEFQINLVELACNVIQYFHSKWNLISTLNILHFIN